jgi:hypothetical protein
VPDNTEVAGEAVPLPKEELDPKEVVSDPLSNTANNNNNNPELVVPKVLSPSEVPSPRLPSKLNPKLNPNPVELLSKISEASFKSSWH